MFTSFTDRIWTTLTLKRYIAFYHLVRNVSQNTGEGKRYKNPSVIEVRFSQGSSQSLKLDSFKVNEQRAGGNETVWYLESYGILDVR